MSRDNVEICRRGWETFKAGMERGDIAGAYDAGPFAPEFEWVVPEGFPGARMYRGRDGFLEFMRIWTEDFDDFELRLERLIDAGDDRVVGLFHHTAIGKGSGVPVELRQGLIYELEDGLIVRCTNFIDHASALRAAGLAEDA